MSFKRTKLWDAIAISLTVGAVSLAGTGIASAQAAPQEQTAKTLDAVSVTGTRIKSQTMTASSPVTEISSEDFKITGATKVEDLVNQYPQLDLSFDNLDNNPSQGYASASLRSLGADRTLTVVNGRRMPSGSGETTDLSIIPAAMVKRVDVLTGGASAVYGADAVAGVVNFVLNDEFEGVSVNLGWSAYQHNNDNKMVQGMLDKRGFGYPTGNSGFDGISRNFDILVGGSFGDGGHAVGWINWRKNDPLYQGDRDYSSCSVFEDEAVCGGSGTANPGRFNVTPIGTDPATGRPYASRGNYIYDGGRYKPGSYVYNYAPVNFYQRPDTRWTAGFMAKYDINEHFTPYIEAMFVDRKSGVQIAESGTFGYGVEVNCSDDFIGTLCADAGVTTPTARVTLWKRNVEGGPRFSIADTKTHRLTAGVRGDINDAWSYDVSAIYGANTWTSIGSNDFLFSRIGEAALNCGAGASTDLLPCYDIWKNNISKESADAMAGTSFTIINTEYKALSGYATGSLGFGLGSAGGEEVQLVAGAERRLYSFRSQYDTDSMAGNFAGAGSADYPVNAGYAVTDYFLESAIPLVVSNSGTFNRLDASLGYRYSDYSTGSSADTYKLGLSAAFLDNTLLLRGGYNRAVRSPTLNDFFYPVSLALRGTADLCAGATPVGTKEQCVRAGVPADIYGSVPANPARQYNGFGGGNPNLQPEVADTYTFGVAWNPIKDLNLAFDWYRIDIEDAIGTIGHTQIQRLCMEQNLYCDRIQRDKRGGSYDLWQGNASDSNDVVGGIWDQLSNIGTQKREGLDFNVNYAFDLGPGRMNASYVATYILKEYNQSLASDPTTGYECKGLINDFCWTPKWRSVTNLRYSFDRYDVGLRWRYVGKTSYKDFDGTKLDTNIWLEDKGGIGGKSLFDLSGSAVFGSLTWTMGVNNVLDKEPPFVGDGTIGGNGNAMGGYDQLGRFFFTSVTFKF